MRNFAKANAIEDLSRSMVGGDLMNGLPHNCGAVDVMKLLEGKGWEIYEILYTLENIMRSSSPPSKVQPHLSTTIT